MGQISKQIFFNAPIEIVWGIWTDVEKNKEWVDGVGESHITSAVKSGPGLSWEEHCMFAGKSIPMEHKMVLWEDKKKTVTRTGLPMGGSIQRIASFKTQGEGTEAIVDMEWDLGIAAAFFDEDELQAMIEKSFDATAARWKSRAENF